MKLFHRNRLPLTEHTLTVMPDESIWVEWREVPTKWVRNPDRKWWQFWKDPLIPVRAERLDFGKSKDFSFVSKRGD